MSSQTDTAEPARPRPNVVVVVFDDLGFADLGCYGSTISTPTVDAIAGRGTLFTNFTATPLCSPTRAALLTGRDPHTVGMGSIVQFASEHPGYNGYIPRSAAMLPRHLQSNGYGTGAFGKWHLAPSHEIGPAGPFDRWPLGVGFDRFYGFLPGKTDHWHPELVEDNRFVSAPDDPGYHLTTDLMDHAITYVSDHVGGRPDDPFMVYLALGAVHSPHHGPPAFTRRYRGRFADGWDIERERRFARQRELGLFEDITPADRNPDVAAWEDLDPDEQEVSLRFMEAYAGFLEHADAELGRFLTHLETLGERDNTVVVVISDNGATNAGGTTGSVNEERILNRLPETHDDRVRASEQLGSAHTLNQYPNGWGQASNTPFRMYKHTLYNGGIRCPLIIDAPGWSGPPIRDEHLHVTDVVPTLLDLAGVTAEDHVDGVTQLPLPGTAFTPDDPARDRGPQHFEVRGYRAVIDGDWKAVTRHEPGTPYEDDTWELYDVATDPAERNDRSGVEPDRLTAMRNVWEDLASADNVYPMDDRGIERLLDPTSHRPNSREWRFTPHMSPVSAEAGPHLARRSFRLVADIEASADDEGVLFAGGGRFSGFSLYLLDGTMNFVYNAAGTRGVVRVPVPERGISDRVIAEFTLGERGGTLSVAVDDHHPESVTIDERLDLRMSVETMQLGRDLGTPVSTDYECPFPFTGTITQVVLTPGKMAPIG